MLMSMISSSAPTATATRTAHLFTAGGAELGAGASAMLELVMSSASRVDRQVDVHAGPEHDAVRKPGDLDAHRNALHDLGEVPTRVVRRQQTEARARRRRQTLDSAAECLARKRVHAESR